MAVNMVAYSNATPRQSRFAAIMADDEPKTWREIDLVLAAMGRGSRAELGRRIRMDRSQLARTLRTKGYPSAKQWPAIDAFLKGRPEADNDAAGSPEAPATLRVPVFGRPVLVAISGGGGEGGVAEDGPAFGERFHFTRDQALDWVELPNGMSFNGDLFLVRAVGSSMEPRIWAGESRLVQRGVPPARDQDVVIEFRDGTAVLKTFRTQRDGVVFASQYNPDLELRFDASTVKALHAVFPL